MILLDSESIPGLAYDLHRHGDAAAIVSVGDLPADDEVMSYRQLSQRARGLAHALERRAPRGSYVGLVASNSADWIAADLGLLLAQFVEVPVPLGFTAEQAGHLLAPCDIVLVDEAGRRRMAQWTQAGLSIQSPCLDIASLRSDGILDRPPPLGPDWICKVIHTSGTTNTPKGVRIRANAISATLASLQAWTQPDDYARYLNLVPFSLLLEQLAGLYLPFSRGGCVVLAPSQPLLGDPGAQLSAKLALIHRVGATALTLTPSLVEALRGAADSHASLGPRERNLALFGRATVPLMAAGGGPVALSTLERLAALGIDVLVGYGLSETSSVVCWNPRHANRLGTVGLPLPGVSCRIADDGELGIRSPTSFAGYVGEDPSQCAVDGDGWLWTGDIGAVDEDGYVTITGRKKNIIITAHGRNVAPEFVEATYRQVAGVRDCVVFGDSDHALSALVLLEEGSDDAGVHSRLTAHGEQHLSAVERVAQFHCVLQNECPDGLFTLTGRPRRERVVAYVGQLLRAAPPPQQPGTARPKTYSHPTVSGGGRKLSTVHRDVLFRQLGESGYLLLRGFDASLAEFSDFVCGHSTRLSLDPARVFHDAEGRPVAQKVDAGTDAIGLHCENGNSPFNPDVCWFYCEVAPLRGSQTTVCDGVEVFEAMSEASRKAFLDRELVYSRRVAPALWRSFVKHGSPGDSLDEDTGAMFARLKALANGDTRTHLELQQDGAVFYRFQTSAISRRSPFRDAYLAFANSIFGPSYNYERPVIEFEDGEAIPGPLLAEVGARCAERTRDIDWQPHDVVVIDNRRVMHGRRAITDTKRSIYNALSYV